MLYIYIHIRNHVVSMNIHDACSHDVFQDFTWQPTHITENIETRIDGFSLSHTHLLHGAGICIPTFI